MVTPPFIDYCYLIGRCDLVDGRIPMKTMEASMCVDVFISNWMACFGVLTAVTTDRGIQFTSAHAQGCGSNTSSPLPATLKVL
jgi:hypothetical protein